MGTGGVSAALAFKAWWQPSFWLALSGGFDFRSREPKFGLNFGSENYGNIRCVLLPNWSVLHDPQHLLLQGAAHLALILPMAPLLVERECLVSPVVVSHRIAASDWISLSSFTPMWSCSATLVKLFKR